MPRLVLLFALVFTVAGCDLFGPRTGSDDPPPPAPLEILGVEVSPEVVRPGDEVTLTVVADRGVVQATWTFFDGSSDSGGATVTWQAPMEAGVYSSRVSVYSALVRLDTYPFDVVVLPNAE